MCVCRWFLPGSSRTSHVRADLPPCPFQGAARVFNPSAANLYNALFAGQAGQRTVANDDPVPTYIPESANYTFTLQGFHITGNGTSNATYGYDYVVCNDPTNQECAGTVGGNVRPPASTWERTDGG